MFITILAIALVAQPCFAATAASDSKQIRGRHQTLETKESTTSKQGRRPTKGPAQRQEKRGAEVKNILNTTESSKSLPTLNHSVATTASRPVTEAHEARKVMLKDVALAMVPARLISKIGSMGHAQQVPQSESALNPDHTTTGGLIGFLVQAFLVVIFAFIYQSKKASIMEFISLKEVPHEKLLVEKEEFAYGLFTCFDEPKLCLLSCCCGAVRWADTVRMMGFFLTLMGGVAIYLCCSLISGLLPGGFCVLLALQVYYRQQMRAAFKMPRGTCMSVCEDCCTYCFCSPCAITQEARQAELAEKVGRQTVAV